MDHESVTETSAGKARLCRLVVVSFGLLCIFQATLNISLRLAFHSSDTRRADFEAIVKSLTEEGDTLKRRLHNFNLHAKQGWVYFGGSFYYISSIKKSWNDSRKDCLQRGADLVTISSREEQNLIRQFNGYTWIGLTDTEEEGTWKWVDGTLLNKSFRYWDNGEPNSYKGLDEDCGEIKLIEDENKWNDRECDSENFWICEKMVDL